MIVAWLVAGGIFFTLYLGFINLTGFAEGVRIVFGRRQVSTNLVNDVILCDRNNQINVKVPAEGWCDHIWNQARKNNNGVVDQIQQSQNTGFQ